MSRWDSPRAWSALAWMIWVVVFAVLGLVFLIPNPDMSAPGFLVCSVLSAVCVAGAIRAAFKRTRSEPPE